MVDHFQVTPPMPTYLLILVVSQFEYVESTGPGGLPIRGEFSWELPASCSTTSRVLECPSNWIPCLQALRLCVTSSLSPYPGPPPCLCAVCGETNVVSSLPSLHYFLYHASRLLVCKPLEQRQPSWPSLGDYSWDKYTRKQMLLLKKRGNTFKPLS